MLFNSILFLTFFAIVLYAYWILPGRFRQYFLIAASIVFYAAWGLEKEGWWGLRWTAHFLGMVLLNYAFVRAMLATPSDRRRKLLMRSIVIIDLLNLGVFKYFDFMARILADLGFAIPQASEGFGLFLPLAISFYTFQLIAFVVDVERGVITKDFGFRRYFLFILFFPQLIAGPIMRSTDFMWQIDNPSINKRRMYDGLWLILGGIVKKVLLADPMGSIVSPIFAQPHNYDGWTLLMAGAGFSLQVYCDFSGYTDIARGAARLLGYEIPENFKAPYFARSGRELWGMRWHITLNTWLRDYIYIPLGGSRVARWRTHLNLAVTFTLGGLWHGADYSYVFWGAFWGILLAIERYVEDDLGIPTTPKKNRVLIVAKVAFVFFLFCLGALMFRSQKVSVPELEMPAAATMERSYRTYSSGEIMSEMFTGLVVNWPSAARDDFTSAGGNPEIVESVFGDDVFALNGVPHPGTFAWMFVVLALFHLLQYREGLLDRFRRFDFWLLLLLGAIVIGIVLPGMAQTSSSFIYFVF